MAAKKKKPVTRWRATVNVNDPDVEAGKLLPVGFKPPKHWIDRGTVVAEKGAT